MSIGLRILACALLGACLVGQLILVRRDLDFHERAVETEATVAGFFAQGGGRGQSRYAQIRFEHGGEPRLENGLLALLCRPEPGPVRALYAAGAAVPIRIDDWRCRNQSLDGFAMGGLFLAVFGGAHWIRCRQRRAAPSATSSLSGG